MSIFEYNARLHEETLKKEGYEDGLEKGREEGREEGIEKGRAQELERILQNALLKGHSPEQIADFTGIPLEEVLKVHESMLESSISQ